MPSTGIPLQSSLISQEFLQANRWIPRISREKCGDNLVSGFAVYIPSYRSIQGRDKGGLCCRLAGMSRRRETG